MKSTGFIFFPHSAFRLLFLLLVLAGAAPSPVFAQITFTGRVINTETGRGVANLIVRVPGLSEARTDDEGIFTLSLPPNTEEVAVELEDGWGIVYPRGGKAVIPRSTNVQVEFEVKQLHSQNQQLRREVDRLSREGKLKDEQIDSLQQAIEDTILAFRQKMNTYSGALQDSLQRKQLENTLLSQKISHLADSLQKVFEGRNREQLYTEISGELLTYLDKLKDLRDELPKVGDVFLHPQADEKFNLVLSQYNEARMPLYNQHQGHLEQLRLYWDDPLRAKELEAVYELALINIHQRIVLPLNDELIGYIQKARLGQMSRIAAQKKARKTALRAVNELTYPILDLERKLNALFTSLKS